MTLKIIKCLEVVVHLRFNETATYTVLKNAVILYFDKRIRATEVDSPRYLGKMNSNRLTAQGTA